jgi:hypothetical protein
MPYNVGSLAVVRAFVARKSRKIKNDTTDGTRLAFHNHVIAVWEPNGDLTWTMCGWGTHTTRLRLNLLFRELGLPFTVYQKNHRQRLWHRGTEEDREISASEIYTVDALNIVLMKHLKG